MLNMLKSVLQVVENLTCNWNSVSNLKPENTTLRFSTLNNDSKKWEEEQAQPFFECVRAIGRHGRQREIK